MKRVFYLISLTVLSLGCWITATLLCGFIGPSELFVIVIFGWLLLLPLTMAARSLNHKVWILTGIIILIGLLIPSNIFVKYFPIQDGEPLGTPLALTQLVIISLALINLSLLLNAGLRLYIQRQNSETAVDTSVIGDQKSQHKQPDWAVTAVLTLGLLLLAVALYKFYWFMVWDNTVDSLGYLWLPIPILVILSASFILFLALPEKTKLAAGLFLLLIPVLITVSAWAQRVDIRQLTEERAARVNQAIEAYYTQKGHYPQNLQQLIPRYAFSVPEPVIIYGQGWCYDGGEDYYRLGYIDREHWSAPHLIGRIYQTKGQAPDLYGICEQEAAALQKRNPDYPYEYWTENQ